MKTKQMPKCVLSMLLLLSMLMSAAACGKSGEETMETNPDAAETTSTEPETSVEDTVYGGLDFEDADMRILYFTHDDYGPYDAIGDNSGDVLLDAVYKRNLAVEEKSHVKLEWIPGSNDYIAHPQIITNAISAGSDDFDTAFLTAQYAFTNMLDGYFLDVGHTKYIDIEDPWWYTSFMKETCITPERYYFVSGAFSLSTLLKSGAVYFNKDMAEDYMSSSTLFYEDVRDGKWTLDKMTEYSRAVTTDTNGDAIMDASDLYGFINDGQATTNYLSTSCGLSFTSRDARGLPVYELYNEQVLDLVERLYVISTDETVMYPTDGTLTGVSGFTAGQALFYFKFLTTTKTLRETEFPWGILPYPTLYEGAAYSCAGSSVNGDAAVLPTTLAPEKIDMCSAVLNALAWEANENVIPVCLEESLKSKYADTPEDREMVEIIYHSISTPFIMVASGFLDGIGSIFTETVFNGKQNAAGYTSYWEANKARYETRLAEMIDTYNAQIEREG